MKKFFALLVMVAFIFMGLPTVAQAAEKVPHKSYVCKYVGKPGVDERLQTGNNPIWVDNHAIAGTDYVNNGDEFKDAQGRSVVIYANVGKMKPEPTIADCPPAQGPVEPPVDDETDEPTPTETPTPTDTPKPEVLKPVKPWVDVANWCGFDRDIVKGSLDDRYTSVTVRESRSTWVTTFTAAPGYKIVGDNPIVTVPSIFDCPVVVKPTPHKHVKHVKHHHKVVKTHKAKIGTAVEKTVTPKVKTVNGHTAMLPNTGGSDILLVVVGLGLVFAGGFVLRSALAHRRKN